MQRLLLLSVLTATTLVSAGCSKARAGGPVGPQRNPTGIPGVPVSPPPAVAGIRPGALLLTGEIASERPAAITIPRTQQWQTTLRWIAEDGTLVKKGDRVAELDGSAAGSTLEDKRIALVEAETEFVRQEAQLRSNEEDRLFKLEERKVALEKARLDASIPVELRSVREHQEKQLALDKARTELAKAEEELTAFRKTAEADRDIKRIATRRAREELETAQSTVDAFVLRAPTDGVIVVQVNPRDGRRPIQEGDMLWPGVVVATLPDPATIRVEASLSDVDAGKVAKGQKALLYPDAFPGRVLEGEVTEIADVAQQIATESSRRAFRVLLPILSGDRSGLKSGMSVRVELPTGPVIPRGDVSAAAAPGATSPRKPPADLEESDEARVLRADLPVTVQINGTLAAVESSFLGPGPVPDIWEYRIARLAPEGSTVKKGAPVLAFDTTTIVQKKQEKEAEADTAKTNIEKRERDHARERQDLELRIAEADARKKKLELKVDVPPELAQAVELAKLRLDFALAHKETLYLERKRVAVDEAKRAEIEVLKGRYERAVLRVKQLTEGIQRQSVAAPRDGTVLYVVDGRDEKKKVGDTAWMADRVLEIPDLSRMAVRGEADEADAALLADGQRAVVRLEAHPEDEFRGRVTKLFRTVQRASRKKPTPVQRFEIALDESDEKRMRPGMRVTGSVEIDLASKVLSVPRAAVYPGPEGPVVYQRKGGKAVATKVTPGRRGETRVEIVSGLAEGDSVLVPKGAATNGKKPS